MLGWNEVMLVSSVEKGRRGVSKGTRVYIESEDAGESQRKRNFLENQENGLTQVRRQ